MIPLRDTIPSKNYPVVNTSLIVCNVLVFLIQLGQGAHFDRFVYIYGLVPARYSVPAVSSYFSVGQQLFSLLSFMFLHGGFWHLLGNMWFLYIFGDNVEDRMGSARYLLFYLLSGLISGLTHLMFNMTSNIPTIGASGAIAGVMGAYVMMFPRARILTLFPIFIIPFFFEIPAYFFLGAWLLLQFLNAAGDHAAGGIAWWAHIGGFLFGMAFVRFMPSLPSMGVSDHIRQYTEKRSTPKLQVVKPTGSGTDPNLYGVIEVSPFEAMMGATKVVNIPWGFANRLFKVTIPPNVHQGSVLRLKGMGRQTPEGLRGDLLLRVAIQQ
jgi:hypothetical protein